MAALYFTSTGMNISIASISDRSKVPNSDDTHSEFFASLTKFINDQFSFVSLAKTGGPIMRLPECPS